MIISIKINETRDDQYDASKIPQVFNLNFLAFVELVGIRQVDNVSVMTSYACNDVKKTSFSFYCCFCFFYLYIGSLLPENSKLIQCLFFFIDSIMLGSIRVKENHK